MTVGRVARLHHLEGAPRTKSPPPYECGRSAAIVAGLSLEAQACRYEREIQEVAGPLGQKRSWAVRPRTPWPRSCLGALVFTLRAL
jgi:hypothetical protein